MSTNALVGIENDDGTIDAVYLHFDGDSAGCTLRQHYATQELARALVERGAISYISTKIEPTNGWPHSFDTPQKGVTVFYHRDRGDDLNIQTYSGITEYSEHTEYYEYLYLYADGEWNDAHQPD